MMASPWSRIARVKATVGFARRTTGNTTVGLAYWWRRLADCGGLTKRTEKRQLPTNVRTITLSTAFFSIGTQQLPRDNYPTISARRLLAISDLHVDYKENLEMVHSWVSSHYRQDALIVAGDVTDNLELLEETLGLLSKRFTCVFFVPGNHELWIRPKERQEIPDSVAKFRRVLEVCDHIGILTRPARLQLTPGESHVWVLPLFSWYATPEDDPDNSLYALLKPQRSPADDRGAAYQMWTDNHLCHWPEELPGNDHHLSRASYFASLNDNVLSYSYDGPVVSFSHMVPRQDLLLANDQDYAMVNKERHRRALPPLSPAHRGPPTPPIFNFSRFAGAHIIDEQLRQAGACVHVYGHQHRNRNRLVEGVRYVQHAVGGSRERREGWLYGVDDGPTQVWPLPPSDPRET